MVLFQLQSETAKQREYDLSRTQATAIGHLLDTVSQIEINQPQHSQSQHQLHHDYPSRPTNQIHVPPYNVPAVQSHPSKVPKSSMSRSRPTTLDQSGIASVGSQPRVRTNNVGMGGQPATSNLASAAFNPQLASSPSLYSSKFKWVMFNVEKKYQTF